MEQGRRYRWLWPVAALLLVAVAVVGVRLIRQAGPLEQAIAASDDGHAHAFGFGANGTLFVGSHGGLFAGPSPRYLRPVPAVSDTDVMAVVPAENGLYVAGHDIGVGLLKDGEFLPLLRGDVHALARGSDGRLVAWIADQNLVASDDDGVTWRPLAHPGLEVLSLSIDPNDPTRIAAAGYTGHSGAIAISTNGGQTWQRNGGINAVTGIVHHPEEAGHLYAAAGGALWASTDGGVTWRRRHQERQREIVAVAFETRRKPTLHVLTSDGKIVEPLAY